MAISPNALIAPTLMDPSDEVDFEFIFGELEDGETISTFTVTPYSDSAALGLIVGSGIRAPSAFSRVESGATVAGVRIWLSIHPTQQSNIVFDDGVTLGVIIRVVTSSNPARTYERSLGVKVVNR